MIPDLAQRATTGRGRGERRANAPERSGKWRTAGGNPALPIRHSRFRHSASWPGIDRIGAASYFSSMALLPIITLPDPLLRKPSAPVERVDDELRALADNMLDTMYDAPGVGLAAVQVGVPRRLIVVDAAGKDEERHPLVLINPEIVRLGPDMRVHEEGCLSIPDVRIEIERPASLRLRYLDRDGKPQELDAEGLLATVVQHEMDHLNGRLIIDFLSRLKRDMIVRKFKKQAKEGKGSEGKGSDPAGPSP
jgi:peptide deformylase